MKKVVFFFFFLTFFLVFCDQYLKIWILQNQNILNPNPDSFFNLVFVENNGIAFGFLKNLGPVFKVTLTLFRVFAVFFVCFWTHSLFKKKKLTPFSFFSLSLIISGAIGNVIDSIFYDFFSFKNGSLIIDFNGSFFQGKVVDMFNFSFFPPVFNLADSFVCVGLFCLFFFQTNLFFKRPHSFWFDLKKMFQR